MIIGRQKFIFKDRVLLEKVILKSPFRYESIFQEEACFLYVIGSPAVINAPDQKVQVNTNESVLLKCGSYFVDWLGKNDHQICEVYAVHLYADVLRQLYRNELPSYISTKKGNKFIRKVIPDNTLSKFIESLNFYFETPSLVNEELLELKVKELLLILMHTKNGASISQLISELFLPKQVSIRSVINTHLYSDVATSKLAEFSNMSISTFNREFEKIYNDTPKNYIIAKRLDRAKELLLNTEAAITTIAYEVGFTDPAYFSRLFKQKFKVAPRTVRKG